MKVTAIPEILEYIENLVQILYEKGYFSYKENARKYVKDGELYYQVRYIGNNHTEAHHLYE